MPDLFFEKPILNSPYEMPTQHWTLDESGQPTQQITHSRRRAELVTPIPKPRKQTGGVRQAQFVLDEQDALATKSQRYQHTAIINSLREEVSKWRELPDPNTWRVTPETARLLQHWRHHPFSGVRPFFCQVEAVETVIWLTEVGDRGTCQLDLLLEFEKEYLPAIT